MPDAMPIAAPPKRRWYQYTLRTLFFVVTLIGAAVWLFIWSSRGEDNLYHMIAGEPHPELVSIEFTNGTHRLICRNQTFLKDFEKVASLAKEDYGYVGSQHSIRLKFADGYACNVSGCIGPHEIGLVLSRFNPPEPVCTHVLDFSQFKSELSERVFSFLTRDPSASGVVEIE